MRRQENQTKLSPARESSVILRSQFYNEKKKSHFRKILLNEKLIIIILYYLLGLSWFKRIV